MKKKIVIVTVLLIIVVTSLLFLSTGGKIANTIVGDYTISEDGNVMTLKVGVASSMGYIRTYKEKQEDDKKYITFYSTYGLNSKFGAKNEFQIDLYPSIKEIYFYRGDKGYALILKKDEATNDWHLAR